VSIVRLVGSRAVLTRPLLACYGVSAAIHVASISLNALVPFRVVDLGGSRTEIGLLFSVMGIVSMLLRPSVGGWIDRFGARPVMLPGIAALTTASLALHVAGSPRLVIAVMVGVGVGSALVATPTNILVARGAGAAHRGEALSLYYLASSLAVAVAPPMALWLRQLGGLPLGFVTATGFTVVVLVLALSLPSALTAPIAGASSAFRAFSRRSLAVSGALVLTTVGYSSIYAFVPLYAISRGHGDTVMWFFAVYSTWLIVCRALLGTLSDRAGRVRVALPAMVLTALAYLALAVPPTPLTLVTAALLLGSASAVLYPTLAALVLDRAPERERGLALGTLSSAWDLGIVVGSAAVGFVADHASFGAGFALAGTTATLGALLFFLTERRRPAPSALHHPAGAHVR
jgi:MFS family permease